ncbi:MAG: TetR/AcrR family transcriptional regulator [Betaproteobacteria bacterium]
MLPPAVLEAPALAPRRERRKHERPGQLLDAALSLFVEKGYAATHMDEVAARAGVSKGTVFLYFPSKLELFKGVVRHKLSNRFEQWNEHFSAFEGSSADLLCTTVLLWWQRVGSTQASGISKLMMSEGANFPEMAEFFNQAVILPGKQILRAVIERGIERGEFVAGCADHAVQGLASVMVFLSLSRHGPSPYHQDIMTLDPEAYLKDHAQWLARGLSVQAGVQGACGGARS